MNTNDNSFLDDFQVSQDNLVELESQQQRDEREFAQGIGDFLKLVNYPIYKEFNEIELLTRTLDTKNRHNPGRKHKNHGRNGCICFNSDYTPSKKTIKQLKLLRNTNHEGCDVFYTVNGQGTEKVDISYLNCLYVDIDKDANGNPILKNKQYEIMLEKMGGLKPTVALDTGGKSLHFYYTFIEPVPKDKGLSLLLDLIDHVRVADDACKDESRILRLPGFLYQKEKQQNPPESKIYSQTGERYSFEQLRAIIPISNNEVKSTKKAKPKGSQGNASKPLKTAKIEGLSLEETAKKVLNGKALEYWLGASNCQDNQDDKLWTVTKELAAGARRGYFSEAIGEELARKMMLSFPTLREDDPWTEIALREKWDRAIRDNSIEYNNESNVLGEIDFDKLDEEFNKLAPGNKNRMIIALLKGGHKLADAEGLLATPIKKNMLTGNIEYLGKPMEISHILYEFEIKFNLTSSMPKFTRTIESEANKNLYNPVEEKLFDCFIRSKSEDYFVNLDSDKCDSRWEKIKKYYNSTIANYQLENKAPNATFKDVFPPIKRDITTIEEFIGGALKLYEDWDVDFVRKFLISAAARAISPGCKVDNVLIIRSDRQGLGKSTFFEELAFDKFYTSKRGNDVTSKDAIEALSRGWINEIDEIERVTCTRDAHDTKSFVSQKHDTYRAAYERISVTRNRHWVLAGTSNDDVLFLDSENRRYNVVSIDEPINIPFVRENLECMWAMVVEAYLNGEAWYYEINSEGAEITRERNKQYMHIDARSELVVQQLGTNLKYVDDIIVAKILEGYDLNHQGNCMPAKKTLQEARRMLKKFDWQKPEEYRVRLHDGRRTAKAYFNPNYLTASERQQKHRESLTR